MRDRLRDEGLCWGHSGRQATQAQFGQTGNQKGSTMKGSLILKKQKTSETFPTLDDPKCPTFCFIFIL